MRNITKLDILQIAGVVILLTAVIGLFVLAWGGRTNAAELQTFIIGTLGTVVTAILSWVAASKVKEKESEAKMARLESVNESLRSQVLSLGAEDANKK